MSTSRELLTLLLQVPGVELQEQTLHAAVLGRLTEEAHHKHNTMKPRWSFAVNNNNKIHI